MLLYRASDCFHWVCSCGDEHAYDYILAGSATVCGNERIFFMNFLHYANMSVQYSAIFKNCKNDNF